MGDRLVLSQEAFEKLLKSIVDFEEDFRDIVNDYYPHPTQERADILQLAAEYVKKFNKALEHVTFQEQSEKHFPFVVIGSEVEIQDIDHDETFKYKIVAPSERDIVNDYISFLSPVGMALLMKEEGETVAVNTPGGVYRYRVKSIALL